LAASLSGFSSGSVVLVGVVLMVLGVIVLAFGVGGEGIITVASTHRFRDRR